MMITSRLFESESKQAGVASFYERDVMTSDKHTFLILHL